MRSGKFDNEKEIFLLLEKAANYQHLQRWVLKSDKSGFKHGCFSQMITYEWA